VALLRSAGLRRWTVSPCPFGGRGEAGRRSRSCAVGSG